MFVEAELTKRLGDTGKRLHTARSRNDQVALDVRMILRAETKEIIELVKKLEHTILDIAEKKSHNCYAGIYSSSEGTAYHICSPPYGVCKYASERYFKT